MSENSQTADGNDDCAFSVHYDHEKKSGGIKVSKGPNALIAGVSLVAMACVTTIASIALCFGLGAGGKGKE